MRKMIQAILVVYLAVLLVCAILAAPFCISYFLCKQSIVISLVVSTIWAIIYLVVLLTASERSHKERR